MNEAVLSVARNMIGVFFLSQWRFRSRSVSLFVKAHMLLTMLCSRDGVEGVLHGILFLC